MNNLNLILVALLSANIAYADVNLGTDMSADVTEGAIDGGRTASLVKSLKIFGNGLKSTLKAFNPRGLAITTSKMVPGAIIFVKNAKTKAPIRDGQRNTSVKLSDETNAIISEDGIYLPVGQASN